MSRFPHEVEQCSVQEFAEILAMYRIQSEEREEERLALEEKYKRR
jgi:hypothetical protein